MSTENHTFGQKRIYFKHQKRCIGREGFGTCTDCMRLAPQIAIGCANMGEYMPKREWNRIFANSPLYNNDIKPRQAIEEELYEGKFTKYGKDGKRLNKFGLRVGRNGI